METMERVSIAKWKTAAIVFITLFVIVAIGLGVLLVMNYSGRIDAETALAHTQDTLETTQDTLETTQEELADIQSRYPLRNFESYGELHEWASANLQSYSYANDLAEFNAVCDVADKAMDEGLRVWPGYWRSTHWVHSYCYAFVGRTLYYWITHSQYFDGLRLVSDLSR